MLHGDLPAGAVEARKQELADDPTVVAATVTPVPTLLQADDRRGDQWGLDALGVPEGSSQLPWPAGAGVTVAVVDSGIDAGHPDLAGAVLARRHYPGEDESRPDPEGHGTHVAGIIAARAGNGGVVGVAPGVSLLDVPAPLHAGEELYNAGAGSIAAAIEWAVNQGADVINMSFGYYYDGLEFDPDDPESLANLEEFTAVAAAIRLAEQRDIVLIASAGNCGPDTDCDHPDAPLVPARLNEVIAVGAVDERLELAGFSSRYGLVELVAPGDDILSSVPGGHQVRPGTSQAAPHVAAAAAIARSANAARSAADIRNALIESAQPLGYEPGFADQDPPVGAGAGLLDIRGMLELVAPPGGEATTGPLYTFDQLVAVLPTAADLPEGYGLLGSCADDPDYCINQSTSQAAAQMLATGDLGRSVSILATVMPSADQAAGRHEVLRGSDRGEAAGPVADTEVAGWTGYRLLTSEPRTDGTADDSRDWLQLVRANVLLEVRLEVPRDGADEGERAARLETWIRPVIAQLR